MQKSSPVGQGLGAGGRRLGRGDIRMNPGQGGCLTNGRYPDAERTAIASVPATTRLPRPLATLGTRG